jgi:alkylation response protein AidB-like acyl-CoA dehydrogenase
MRKAGELGLLGVAVPEAYGGLGMGFVSTMLVCDYISGATVHSRLLWSTYRNWNYTNTLYGSEEQN